MKYKGFELVEVTEPIAYKQPREMLVWGTGDVSAHKERISAITNQSTGVCAVSWHGNLFPHCAEIPEEPKPRRVTNRELYKWQAHGKGEAMDETDQLIAFCAYPNGTETYPVVSGIKVRKWDDDEWHEPDVQYMGIEE